MVGEGRVNGFCWFLRSLTSVVRSLGRFLWSLSSKGQSMISIICKSKCTTSCNLIFGGAYNAVKSNLMELATKSVCVPLRVRRNCYVHTPVHSLCQRSLMPCGFWEALAPMQFHQRSVFLCVFAVFMHLSQ